MNSFQNSFRGLCAAGRMDGCSLEYIEKEKGHRKEDRSVGRWTDTLGRTFICFSAPLYLSTLLLLSRQQQKFASIYSQQRRLALEGADGALGGLPSSSASGQHCSIHSPPLLSPPPGLSDLSLSLSLFPPFLSLSLSLFPFFPQKGFSGPGALRLFLPLAQPPAGTTNSVVGARAAVTDHSFGRCLWSPGAFVHVHSAIETTAHSSAGQPPVQTLNFHALWLSTLIPFTRASNLSKSKSICCKTEWKIFLSLCWTRISTNFHF